MFVRFTSCKVGNTLYITKRKIKGLFKELFFEVGEVVDECST